jgi:signal transduction histidine kinase
MDTLATNRRLRLILAAHSLWLAAVFALGVWWGKLALRQAARVAQLEAAAGLADAAGHWARTQRMVYWESLFYVAMLLTSASVLFWLYWRDMLRSRGLHAFFASVTHELRTPLTSIRLQAESIGDLLTGNEPAKPLVNRLLEDTMRLEGQVERTLELARVEGGGPVFSQALQLKPLLDRMIQSWRETYGSRVTFQTEIEDLAIEADTSAMQVILKNLLENALRHSRKECVLVRIRAESEGANVRLSFQDDGAGFTGNADRLGEIFEKGPASHGAGVGLYLISLLMKKMGGRAAFSPANGFKVTLWFRGVQNGG